MLRRFIELNRKACARLSALFPQTRPNLEDLYIRKTAEFANASQGQTIIDVGGGKSCAFAQSLDPDLNARIIAIDISDEEMRDNDDVHEKRVVDITKELPFEEESVDLITSRSVLEHLEDIEAFLGRSHRVLKTGGHCIHFFPSKFAPFALLNQALPHALSKTIMHLTYEDTKGICGFPAFYDRCYHSAFRRLLERKGFDITFSHCGYYQAHYFSFFVPLYLLNGLYEMVVSALGLRNLGAYLMVVARKR